MTHRKPCVAMSTSTNISNFRSHASPIRSHDSFLLLLPCRCIWLLGPGFQDLSFRTSIFGSQDLGFRTSIFGSQDLGFRTSMDAQKLSILRSSYFFLVTFLCVQWSQTNARTDRQAAVFFSFTWMVLKLPYILKP
jgi:hypothetical protein